MKANFSDTLSIILLNISIYMPILGVTLAQLVKASVGQADVQRFEPKLGHELRCVSCKVLWAPSGTTIRPNLSQRVARSLYKRGVFTKSIPEKTRTITVPSLRGL